MSGGHFNYQQYQIDGIADQILELIRSNDDKSLDEFGDRRGAGFDETTIQTFKDAVRALRTARVYAQRVDWLVSGDDGEDTFHPRLKEDLQRLQARLEVDFQPLHDPD